MTRKAPSLIDKYVASRIRLRRIQMGISQEELAQVLGITFQQVQKYEKGDNRISAGRLYEIARLLRAPLSFFYEGSPESGEVEFDKESARAAEILATPWAANLIRMMIQFDRPEIWKALTSLAVVMANEMDQGSATADLKRRSG